MLPNGLDWEVYEKSILCLGAIVVGLDTHASPQHHNWILKKATARVLIVQNPDVLQNIDLAALPSLHTVISVIPLEAALTSLDASKKFVAHATCITMSTSVPTLPEPPTHHDIATIIYTSGTTGEPKGIAYTHRQCLLACQSIMTLFPSFSAADVTMCILPLSHLFQRIINLCSIAVGSTVYFIEDPRHFQMDIGTINPTVMVGVPRLYEKIQEAVEQKLGRFPLTISKLIPAALIRRNIFGNRIRLLMTGAAPVALQTHDFFRKIGIPLHEAYGLSENIVPMTMNTLESARDGSVGKVLPENEVRFTEEGEILVRGEGVFSGYWQERPSHELFTEDGFYRTGDLGYRDANGFLYLSGRKDDLIKTSTGRRIAPRSIEERLLTIPDADIAIVFGNARKNLTALIRCRVPVDANYIRTVRSSMEAINAMLIPHERICGVLLTNHEFNIANRHLTPSLKLRRKFIEEEYKHAIDRLYSLLETSDACGLVIEPLTANVEA